MASYIFNEVITGSNLFSEYKVAKTAADTLQLKLYTNVITFTQATVVADLTECADAGYAAYSLADASWTITWDTDHSNAVFTVDNTITFAAAAGIYGMYLTNTAGTVLMGVAEFGGIKNFDAGDQLTFTEGILANKPV